MIWLVIGIALGFLIGTNHKSRAKVVRVQDEDLQKELSIAKNLNESLLQDKRDLYKQIQNLKDKHGL